MKLTTCECGHPDDKQNIAELIKRHPLKPYIVENGTPWFVIGFCALMIAIATVVVLLSR